MCREDLVLLCPFFWFDPGGTRTMLVSSCPGGRTDFISQMSEELLVVVPGLKWPRALLVLQ